MTAGNNELTEENQFAALSPSNTLKQKENGWITIYRHFGSELSPTDNTVYMDRVNFSNERFPRSLNPYRNM